jgi:hypothetical protein
VIIPEDVEARGCVSGRPVCRSGIINLWPSGMQAKTEHRDLHTGRPQSDYTRSRKSQKLC